ncbi:MAG: hypothetical protein Q8N56_01165 [bacterium]|nr:hypothetical protein [bacterium]
MEIDLMPKRTTEKILWQAPLFFLSLGLLLVFVIGAIFLTRSVKKTGEKVAALNEEILKEKSKENIALEQEILNVQKKLVAFDSLIKERKEVSKAFDLIEKRIHPQVVLNRIDYDFKEDKILLGGVADNFQILGQQSSLLKQDPSIREANFPYIGIEKTGGVGFNLEIVFNPGFFQD